MLGVDEEPCVLSVGVELGHDADARVERSARRVRSQSTYTYLNGASFLAKGQNCRYCRLFPRQWQSDVSVPKPSADEQERRHVERVV